MLKANKIKEMQNTVEGAFKPNEPALVSRSSGVMESRPWHTVITKSWLYNSTAQTCNVQRMLFDAGGGQENSLQCCLQAIEQSLKSLKLGAVMRRRGVPRRGSRSGV